MALHHTRGRPFPDVPWPERSLNGYGHRRDCEWNQKPDAVWLFESLRGRDANSDMRVYSPVQCAGCTRPCPPEVCPTWLVLPAH